MRLSQLHPNEGQINGVPNNPRKITDAEFDKLRKSIFNSREFLVARPIIVDEEWNILGGNMRYRACCSLRDEGAKNGKFVFTDEIPEEWVKMVHWTRKKKREFVLRDNETNGERDMELLALWDADELASWDIELDDLVPEVSAEDLDPETSDDPDEQRSSYMDFVTVKEKRHKLWSKDWKQDAATNLKEYPLLHYLDGKGYVSIFRKSNDGVRLIDIKKEENREYIEVFAQSALKILQATVSIGDPGTWCIITTPRRRHADGYHFATEVCKRLSELTGIRFEQDVAVAHNHNRLHPNFERVKDFAEPNVILYDDIITTGSTLIATRALFPDKNIVTVINVCNRGAIMK